MKTEQPKAKSWQERKALMSKRRKKEWILSFIVGFTVVAIFSALT